MELRTWSLFLSTVGFYLVHDAIGQSASGNGSEFALCLVDNNMWQCGYFLSHPSTLKSA